MCPCFSTLSSPQVSLGAVCLLLLLQLLLLLPCLYLDEGSHKQEAVGQANLHPAEDGSNTSAVCWQLGQDGGHGDG